jgi:undecaprenyl-diphosphatase
MALWFAAVLGIVQGLTEFLPISSTAHLRVVPAFLGQPDPGAAYSAVIQLGTLLAVMVYFARDLFVTMPKALLYDRDSPEGRLPVYLVLGTVPIAVLGLTFKDFIVGDARSLYVVSASLVVVGVLMWLADRFGRQARGLVSITLTDAAIIGLAQACALVPGVSRSGSTIAMALVLGLRRSDAARFSFLLGVPAIAGSGLFELPDAMRQLGEDAWMSVTVGILASAVSGYLAIAWLLRFLARNSLAPFSIYRIVLGILIAGLCIAGLLEPGSNP